MKKSFICSIICNNGIIGGSITIDENSITYKTNKLTVDRKYRNLVLPLDKVFSLSWKWVIFPIATIKLTNGEEYKFLIFNKKGFNNFYSQVKEN